jgi:23S rRNA pseudouridine1911/1915/1917 synthase
VATSQASRRYEFVVAESEGGERLDRFLVGRQLPLPSRSQVKRLIDQGLCQVNGNATRPAKKLKAGDLVELEVPPPAPDEALPENIELTVLYEDEHLIVVDKPAGMVVHPAAGHTSGTLVNALLGHCKELSGVGGTLRPGIVHRLDKLTSGVLVASKTDEAHLGLAAQFAEHSVERRYITVVAGQLEGTEGTFDTVHRRHPTDRRRFTSRPGGERAQRRQGGVLFGGGEGRRAVTHWRVLERLQGATLVEARLETGRTHQVRVHFADGGHAVLGDPMYGRTPAHRLARDEGRRLGRQALHARVLGFEHPVTGERLRYASPVPPDMARLIETLRATAIEERKT